MWPEPATPCLARLSSGHRARPSTELSSGKSAHRPVPCRLANALARSLFVQRLRFLAKFSQHKDQHLGTAPECGEEVVSARQMFQQSMS